MRIDTRLSDDDRDAVKEYAVNHGYTMKQAYTALIRDGLHDRFLMRISTETGNLGVKFAGHNNSITTNIAPDYFMDTLRKHNGEWVCIYAPRWYALERAGIDAELEPLIWDTDDEDAEPLSKLDAE